jgi:hypothetical protein
MTTALTGEGAVYPHGWTGSGWVSTAVETDGKLDTVAHGEDAGGVKRKLLVATDGGLQSDCYGADSLGTKKKLRTNTNGELIVQTSTDVTSEVNLPRTTYDGFGRIRISENFTIFNSKQITDNQPVLWDTAVVGTGTAVYSATEASTVLTVAAPGDSVIRQTYRRFNYQPGKSQLAYFTGIIRNAGTFNDGIISRIGQHSVAAGMFFQYDSVGGIQVGIRKNSVDTLVPQASWNVDKLDGTGASGITLDVTKSQIFVINYEWLAVGSVWFGFVIGGAIKWAHRADNANIVGGVYTQTPNNPVRYEIISTTGASGAITQTCCSVISEGGTDPSGNTFAVGLTTEIALNIGNPNPEQVLMAIRYKNESSAQIEIDFTEVTSVANTANDVYMLVTRLVKDVSTQLRNAANTGPPVLTYSPIVSSALEVARPAAAYVVSDTFLGGSGYVLDIIAVQSRNTSSANIRSTIKLGWSLAGASDVLVISAFPLDNTSVTAAFSWVEL